MQTVHMKDIRPITTTTFVCELQVTQSNILPEGRAHSRNF